VASYWRPVVSPTLLARLRRVELVVKRWQSQSYRECLELGYSPERAAYHSARCCWPDAVRVQRMARWQY
jgi:hypothetical protein